MKASMILTLAACLTAAPAFAQQGTPEQVIAYLDLDKDGKCSLNEYLHFQQPRIAQFDANGDGVLQFAEFKASLAGDGKRNAQRSWDTFNVEDNHRALTQREFLGYHAFVFKNYVDTDHDGFMSAAEWSKLMESVN